MAKVLVVMQTQVLQNSPQKPCNECEVVDTWHQIFDLLFGWSFHKWDDSSTWDWSLEAEMIEQPA